MSRKYSLPKFPESYVGEKSQEYNDSLWMERNQKKTTLSCINYLYDEKLDKIGNKKSSLEKESIILDLGCGSGFSSEVLSFKGFRVVAIDILIDMLNKARQKKKKNFLNMKI